MVYLVFQHANHVLTKKDYLNQAISPAPVLAGFGRLIKLHCTKK